MKTLDKAPQTESGLRRDLRDLGIESGQTLVVHSSLSALGWVVGGAPTVVRALLATLGEDGTLAMPAATPQCADPVDWATPKIPERWLDEVRGHLPLFDPATTPTALGVIPETFRNWPGTLRSDHPLESVCARGPAARQITEDHPLEFSEGPGSPFGKLYDLDSRVLLLGVGFDRCTALHLADTLSAKRRTMRCRFPTQVDGQRVWTEVSNVADDNGTHFPEIGARYVAAREVRQGRVGDAPSWLFPMRDLVDFAVGYFDEVF